jgi:signal transduction histidine kinase
VRKTFQIACHFTAKGVLPKLPHHAASQLYKIAQDAIGNAIKHGNATMISLCLFSEPGQVRLMVKDNGLPFINTRNPGDGTGWRIMHSRAGLIGATLEITPQEGQGMVVTCTLPVSKADGTAWLSPLPENGDPGLRSMVLHSE